MTIGPIFLDFYEITWGHNGLIFYL